MIEHNGSHQDTCPKWQLVNGTCDLIFKIKAYLHAFNKIAISDQSYISSGLRWASQLSSPMGKHFEVPGILCPRNICK